MSYKFDPLLGEFDQLGTSSGGSGSGDVTGPASAADNSLARFDGTTGKLLQESVVLLDDTGNVSGFVNIHQTGYKDMVEIATPAAAPADTLRFYASDKNGFNHFNTIDSTGLELQITQDNVSVVRNNSGSTILKGKAIVITGALGNRPTIALARADSGSTMPCAGITIEDISNNADGRIMNLGVLENLDTSSFSAGDLLYVSATAAGIFTEIEPRHPNFIQRLGIVSTSHASVGRLNIDIDSMQGHDPGSNEPAFTIGDAASAQTNLIFSGSFDGTLKSTITADRTWSWPDKSGTIAIVQDSTGLIDLSDEVTGTLAASHGGTNNATLPASNYVIYSDGTKYTGASTMTFNPSSVSFNLICPTDGASSDVLAVRSDGGGLYGFRVKDTGTNVMGGDLEFATDGTYEIGGTAAGRPYSAHFSYGVDTPGIISVGNIYISKFSHTTNGVNYIQLANNITGSPAQVQSQGSDTNVGVLIKPKGTGALTVANTTGTATQSSFNSGLLINSAGGTASADEFRINANTRNYSFVSSPTNGYLGVGFTSSPTLTALMDIDAGGTSQSQLRLRSGAAPSSPNEGDLWNDSTTTILKNYGNGFTKSISNMLYVNTADGTTVSNTVSETSAISSITLPANYFVTGKSIRTTFAATYVVTGTPTITIKLKKGSTALAVHSFIPFTDTTGGRIWFEAVSTARSTTSLDTTGMFIFYDYSGQINGYPWGIPATIGTGSEAWDITVQFSVASASNQLTAKRITVEELT